MSPVDRDRTLEERVDSLATRVSRIESRYVRRVRWKDLKLWSRRNAPILARIVAVSAALATLINQVVGLMSRAGRSGGH